MDKIKDLANKAKGATGGSSSGGSAGGKEDYADKGKCIYFLVRNFLTRSFAGLDSAETKMGMDPSKMRSTNEQAVSFVTLY